jgi:hypothetical protein
MGQLSQDEVGNLVPPNPTPTDTCKLLELMEEAFHSAIKGEPGSRPLERGKMLFYLLSGHFQHRSVIQIGEAHNGLERATTALKLATWWLAAVTVLLGLVEILGFTHN